MYDKIPNPKNPPILTSPEPFPLSPFPQKNFPHPPSPFPVNVGLNEGSQRCQRLARAPPRRSRADHPVYNEFERQIRRIRLSN